MSAVKQFGQKLLSRKFLLTFGAVAVALANHQYTAVIALVLGYLGVQGYADVVAQGQKT